MRLAIAILGLLSAGASGRAAAGDDYRVVSNLPPAYRVESHCPAEAPAPRAKGCVCGVSCKCKAGDCPAKCPVAATGDCPCPVCHCVVDGLSKKGCPTDCPRAPPGYPPAPPGFRWAKFPGGVWGLVQDGCEVPKTGVFAAPARATARPVVSYTAEFCPLGRP